MKQLLTTLMILLGLINATAVEAQNWTGPGQQPVVLPLLANAPDVLGDGTTPSGGTPPAANDVAPIASNFDIKPFMDCSTRAADLVPANLGCGAQPTSEDSEAKFRTHCMPAKAGWFDPILYPGKANVGHAHLFMGNTAINKDSTYQTLRTTGNSTCGGGKINRSAYWIPCLMLDKNKCLKPNYAVVYYNLSPASDRAKYTEIPNGLAYVGGFDINDPTDARRRAYIAANNGRPGQTAYYEDRTGNGASWKCGNNAAQSANAPYGAGTYQPWLRSKDGSWKMTCGAPAGQPFQIVMGVNMPDCWDGKNLNSPGARLHVMQKITDGQYAKSFCPNGWYRITQFEIAVWYTVTDADMDKIYLSSDRMDSNSANWFNPGQTAHNDWFGAWDPEILNTWQANCNGIKNIPGQPANPTPRSCIDTSYGDGRKGTLTGNPDGNAPTYVKRNGPRIVDLGYDPISTGPYRYYPVTPPVGTGQGHTMGH